MTNRFVVISEGIGVNEYYWIRDNDFNRWTMPEKAISLNFATQEKALIAAKLLNSEWQRFLNNPY